MAMKYKLANQLDCLITLVQCIGHSQIDKEKISKLPKWDVQVLKVLEIRTLDCPKFWILGLQVSDGFPKIESQKLK